MRLILNGDDLGYSPAVNEALFDLFDGSRLSSTSLVVNLPHSQPAIEGARARPGLAVGLHLNLTKGRPCLPPDQVSSLIRRGGFFFPSPLQYPRLVSGLVRSAEVVAEVRAQIECALGAGLCLSHLDSHSHWHLFPPYHNLLRQLAVEYDVPRVRLVDVRRALVPNRLWLTMAAGEPASHRRPAETDYMLSMHHWLDDGGKPSPQLNGCRLCKLLGRPAVTAEVVIHPGRSDDPHFPPDTLPAHRRQMEVDFLQGAAFGEWLEAIHAEIVGGLGR